MGIYISYWPMAMTVADAEGKQNSWSSSLTNHYDDILIEWIVSHSSSCILLPSGSASGYEENRFLNSQ